MSYHSQSKWKGEDELTDEVVDEIVYGLKRNLEYYGDGYTAGAYIIMCAIDNCIYNVGKLLDRLGGNKATEQKVNKFCGDDNECITLVSRVLIKMGKLEPGHKELDDVVS